MGHKKSLLILTNLVLVFILLSGVFQAAAISNILATDTVALLPFVAKGRVPVAWDIKGTSLTAYWHDSYALPDALDQIDYLTSIGSNSVSILVNWYQDSLTSTSQYPSATLTIPDTDLETIITYAHQKGLRVTLKPHLETSAGDWRGWLIPDDHNLWFDNYTKFMQHYAELAERNGVELLVIGTEYRSLTQSQQDLQEWADLADHLRTIYHGKLAYAAHESGVLGHDEGYEIIPSWFWEHFDYAGTTVYYTLSENQTPSVHELIDAWHETLNLHDDPARYLDELSAWQISHGKPVLFAEIGYRSVDCAAYAPFNVSGNQCPNASNSPESNEQAQANAYDAFFQAFEDIPWLAGVYWWQFEARPITQRECAYGLTGDTNFTPCGKLAGDILRQWYGGRNAIIPPSYTPALPIIDDFEYPAPDQLHFDRTWVPQSSGTVIYQLAPGESPPASNGQQALFISTNIPLDIHPRYQQLAYTFAQPQDFSDYSYLELWVKGDGKNQPPYGGEFSVVLLDGDNEPWQSTRWLARVSGTPETNGWAFIQIRLAASDDVIGDPWQHPDDFIIPDWVDPHLGNGLLDLDKIKGIWIKSFTTKIDSEFVIWLDDLRLNTAPVFE